MHIPRFTVTVFFIGIYEEIAVARVGRVAYIGPTACFGKTLFKVSGRNV